MTDRAFTKMETYSVRTPREAQGVWACARVFNRKKWTELVWVSKKKSIIINCHSQNNDTGSHNMHAVTFIGEFTKECLQGQPLGLFSSP